MGANPDATSDDTFSAQLRPKGRAGDAGRAIGLDLSREPRFVPKRQARYRLFDVSWRDGCEKGAGRVGSVRLGEQREKFAVLDGQAFIVASE
jgi:hypothetical protein